jgi:hypothetical protein
MTPLERTGAFTFACVAILLVVVLAIAFFLRQVVEPIPAASLPGRRVAKVPGACPTSKLALRRHDAGLGTGVVQRLTDLAQLGYAVAHKRN